MAAKQSKQQDQAKQAKPGKIASLIRYFEESKVELGKVSWPTKKEVKVTFLAVIGLVVVMAIFLGVVDFLWTTIVQAILSIGLII